MWRTVAVWLKGRYDAVVNSIAFLPAGLALLFLAMAVGMIMLDFSDLGKNVKSEWNWLRLQDASTARAICSAIAGGIMSLSVFSFSMVMVVLNQAASQMSNRVLDKLIGNRFQQIVLGIYVGTIVYALFLLSTIRDTDSGIHIAALSTYLLILMAILSIFLFIYFLHYITESIKLEVVVERIYKQTHESLQESCHLREKPIPGEKIQEQDVIVASKDGIYEKFSREGLITRCGEYGCAVEIVPLPGDFVLKGMPVLKLNRKLGEDEKGKLEVELQINDMQRIERNCYYGFRQLMEVALKALSPGLNDPGSAVACLRALFRLFSYRACFHPEEYVYDEEGKLVVHAPQMSLEEVIESSLRPIWDYGSGDRLIRSEMFALLRQLNILSPSPTINSFLHEVRRCNEEKMTVQI